MKSLQNLAFSLVVGAAAFVGCRGSVERVFEDDLAGADASVDVVDASASSSTSSGGDSGGSGKEHDASDDGPPPVTAPAAIKGTVIGLVGAGLVLQNNLADDLTVTAGGAFAFATPVGPGQPYAVTVRSQPTGPSQTCTVANGSGVAMGVDVVDVAVTCATNTYPVSVTVSGLTAGQSVVLTNNGGNDLTVSSNAKATFANPVPSGAPFNVTVKSTTGGATCSVSGGTGSVVASAVDSVVVNCTPGTFTISGTVTGLAGSLVLTTNGVDRTVSSSSFSFPPLASGTAYDVTVKTGPVYPPRDQTCTVSNGQGTLSGANVTNVAVACTTKSYTVSGTVTGLTGTGLELRNDNTDPKVIAGTSFSFTVASGNPYAIGVGVQPTGQSCAVSNGTGTVQSANVTNVLVTCGASTLLSESFDGVSSGLPAGWTSTSLVGSSNWSVRDDGSARRKSAPNAAFVNNSSSTRDTVLVSPSFNVTSTSAKVSFWHFYDTEEDYDGGVLEISIGGGAWLDILAAGGSFASGGYDCVLKSGGPNPLRGRSAWCDRSTRETTANLPPAAAGQAVQLRWRFGSDDGVGGVGWYVDDVVVTN